MLGTQGHTCCSSQYPRCEYHSTKSAFMALRTIRSQARAAATLSAFSIRLVPMPWPWGLAATRCTKATCCFREFMPYVKDRAPVKPSAPSTPAVSSTRWPRPGRPTWRHGAGRARGRECTQGMHTKGHKMGKDNQDAQCPTRGAQQRAGGHPRDTPLYKGHKGVHTQGGGFGKKPWYCVLICNWQHLLADRHSLPFPSLSLNECPLSCCFGPPFPFLHRWRIASTKTLRIHTAIPFTSTRSRSCSWRGGGRRTVGTEGIQGGGGGGEAREALVTSWAQGSVQHLRAGEA